MSEDLFSLFEANANGMDEFARLAGMPLARREAPRLAAPAQPRPAAPSWWERVSLVTRPKRPRRRLSQPLVEVTALGTGT